MKPYDAEINAVGKKRQRRKIIILLIAVALLVAVGYAGYVRQVNKTLAEVKNDDTKYSSFISDSEKNFVNAVISKSANHGSLNISTSTTLKPEKNRKLGAYVFAMNAYAVRSNINSDELKNTELQISGDIDSRIAASIAEKLSIPSPTELKSPLDKLPDNVIAIVPADELSPKLKLLSLNNEYYLDSFDRGAVFRQAEVSGDNQDYIDDLKLDNTDSKDKVLSYKQTGVTALARLMQRKLEQNNKPLYFSEKIRDFLRDADVTHTSNEVSFKQGCVVHNSSFCSDPRFIETLKDSGFDIIELTGNHNNDVGSQFNEQTIKLYHSLGWQTFGGGLNAEEAAKPALIHSKNNSIALLGYNYADSPNSGAIAKVNSAGANQFDLNKIKSDIAKAKEKNKFVIVDIQFFECYSYPNGYTEMPSCDGPIKDQKETFRAIVNAGADMVVGTQAHHPQTYELYNGKPIYYGLGNLYFDQTDWPGTERGIVLTHYFKNDQLLQTRLTPTVYDKDLQVQVAAPDKAEYLMKRLSDARKEANLANPFNE